MKGLLFLAALTACACATTEHARITAAPANLGPAASASARVSAGPALVQSAAPAVGTPIQPEPKAETRPPTEPDPPIRTQTKAEAKPRAPTLPRKAASAATDGFAALGLTGLGEGGEGRGEGVCLCPESPHEYELNASFGAVQVDGALPRVVVERVVSERRKLFLGCYKVALRRAPRLEGRVTVAFDIDASGEIANVSDAGSAVADATMLSCVIKNFAKLHFPPPSEGEVKVIFPVNFLLPPPRPAR